MNVGARVPQFGFQTGSALSSEPHVTNFMFQDCFPQAHGREL